MRRSAAFLLLRDMLNAAQPLQAGVRCAQLREIISRSVPLGGHHIGTARMAATARQGVVDSNCAMFELPNVHIASSAVFPTSSHANPTLTIVALALRLADHLKSKTLPGERRDDRDWRINLPEPGASCNIHGP